MTPTLLTIPKLAILRTWKYFFFLSMAIAGEIKKGRLNWHNIRNLHGSNLYDTEVPHYTYSQHIQVCLPPRKLVFDLEISIMDLFYPEQTQACFA